MCKKNYGVVLVLAWLAPLAHMDVAADSIQSPQSITSPCVNIGLDDVFAVSYATGELIKFQATDPGGTKTTLLPGGSLVSPTALIVGPDCDLYIGESGDGSTFAPRISKFEIDTLTLSTVYPFSAFDVFPGSFVFLGDDLLIGREPRFSNTGPVIKLSGATGGALAVSDYTSGGPGNSSPGLALDPLGRLYFSDQNYNFGTSIASGPVSRFDDNGISTVIADGNDGLAGPAGLVYRAGKLYVASYMSGEILQTDLISSDTQAFADTGTPFAADRITALVDGTLWVGGSGGGNLYEFSDTGTLLRTFASGLADVGGVTSVAAYNPSIGGSVSGLGTNQSLVLQNNARDDLTLSANGNFTFDYPLPQGSDYLVSIKTQPAGQTCSLVSATGTALGSNVTNVQVSCVNNTDRTYRISSVTGDTISGTLVFSGSLASDGTFSFLSDGAPLSSPAMNVTWVDSRTYQVTGSGTMVGTFVMPGYLPEGQQDFASDGSPLSSPFFSWNGGISEGLPNQNDDFLVTNGLVTRVKYDVAPNFLQLRLDGFYEAGDSFFNTYEFGSYVITPDGETTDTSDFSTLPDQNDSYVISGGQLTAVQYDLLGSTFELKLQADGSFLVREGSTDVGGGTYSLSALYAIGGSVSGLASSASLVLKNNGGDDLTINANGDYVFSTLLANSEAFNVTVATQPVGQTCSLSNSTGTVSGSDVSNIAVNCTTNSYSIGGVLTGLADGLSVTLQNNGANDLALTNDGAFSFTSPVLHNTGYAVSVSNQPSTQTCVVSDGSGTVNGSEISNVAVSCSDNNYSVGGLVSGLLPETSLVLQKNGGDDLTVTANGAFTFDGLLLQGSAYAVTIKTQPVGQTCSLNNAIGASINANLTNIEVVCSVNSYAVGGVVNGLATGLSVTLQNNGVDELTLSANGNFIFASLVPYNSSYSVSVDSQPSTQTCVVSDGSGTVSAAAITDVVVACTDNTFSVGGELSGLLPGRSLVLQNNAGDDLSVSGNGAFAFSTGLTSGSDYVVSVKTQPAGQECSVDAGSGSVAAADIVDVTIACTVIPTIFRDQFQGST